ncbi:glycosyltransferase [Elusimicrobiota bacterium]
MKRRVLLVTHTPPPIVAGNGIILERLFRLFPSDSYVVLSSSHEYVDWPKDKALPCSYYTTSVPSFLGGYDWFTAIGEWISILPSLWSAWKITRREKITSILVVPSSGTLLLLSCLLSLLARVNLSVYFLDLFSCNNHFRLRRWLSGPIERLAVARATAVFVMSEALKTHYVRRYSIDAIVLPHPIELADHGIAVRTAPSDKAGGAADVIVFTGFIYEYQLDPLQNLSAAVNKMDSVELHIYTSRSNAYLARMGVTGKNVRYRGFIEPERISRVQQEADILFLPMSFRPPEPRITETASPGKLPEYLVSGTPILVHAPAYAYISWYARKHGWGVVVEQADPEALVMGIRAILDDDGLSRRLVEKAYQTAHLHEGRMVSGVLQRAIGLVE